MQQLAVTLLVALPSWWSSDANSADLNQDSFCEADKQIILQTLNELSPEEFSRRGEVESILVFGEQCDQEPVLRACAERGIEECAHFLRTMKTSE